MNGIRHPPGLTPKNQPVSGRKRHLPETLFAASGHQPEIGRSVRTGPEGGPVVVMPQVEPFPVIHSCSPEVTIGDLETQRVNQMQPQIRIGAQPADISRILRNLGAKEDDMQKRLHDRGTWPYRWNFIIRSTSSISVFFLRFSLLS